MSYESPQYMDDLIRSRVRTPGMPQTRDVTGLRAAHMANQTNTLGRAELIGQQLGLGRKALKQNREQFDERLKRQKRNDLFSNIIGAAGLGLSIREANEQKKRDQEITDIINQMTMLLSK